MSDHTRAVSTLSLKELHERDISISRSGAGDVMYRDAATGYYLRPDEHISAPEPVPEPEAEAEI